MEQYVYQKEKYDIADMIKVAPHEMQWYGEYMYYHHRQNFYPLDWLFSLVYKESQCVPNNGWSWDYGVLFNNVKSSSKKYQNSCGAIRTWLGAKSKEIRRWRHSKNDISH